MIMIMIMMMFIQITWNYDGGHGASSIHDEGPDEEIWQLLANIFEYQGVFRDPVSLPHVATP